MTPINIFRDCEMAFSQHTNMPAIDRPAFYHWLESFRRGGCVLGIKSFQTATRTVRVEALADNDVLKLTFSW